MAVFKSKWIDLVWKIKCTEPLQEIDIEFIKGFVPSVFFNEREFYHWAFDTKLPSGKWLENIKFTNALDEATAEIY